MSNVAEELNIMMPWFEPHRQHVIRQLRDQQLPHASLLAGPEGQGKETYVTNLAQVLLCDDGNGCGVCRSCQLLAYGHHPDLLLIAPMPPSLTIRIAQIRELSEFMTLLPHTAQRKVAVIHQADRLNKEASNALLKTLEEPPNQCYLLLSSSFPKTLLPTISSRLQSETLPSPTAEQSLAFLQAHFANESVSAEQLSYAVKRFPKAPMRAVQYIADQGVQIEKQLLRWLHVQWIDGAVQAFPSFPQLHERYPDRIKRSQVELDYLLQVVTTLVRYQAQPKLVSTVKHSDTINLINTIPMGIMQSYHRQLLQAIPRLGQLTVSQHITAITQTVQGAL